MKVYTFDPRSARPVDYGENDFLLAPVTGVETSIRVIVQHLDPRGRVARHTAAARHLLCVTTGWGWVRAGDGEPYRIRTGYAALFEAGEPHELWTDDEPLTGFLLEGELTVPARLVKGEPVEVRAHDPAWQSWFEQVRERVAPAVADLPARIEHVGSTAVPGLAARPVVDVDVVVSRPEDVPAAIQALGAVGYRHRGELGVPGRQAFVAPADLPPHELAVVVEGGQPHLDHVQLRDHLRANPDDVVAYEAVKRRAALEAVDDLEVYWARTGPYVAALVELARARQGGTAP